MSGMQAASEIRDCGSVFGILRRAFLVDFYAMSCCGRERLHLTSHKQAAMSGALRGATGAGNGAAYKVTYREGGAALSRQNDRHFWR